MAVSQTDRVELEYDLIFTMPFHFGTGLRSGLLDRTVVRDRNGYLYVPASTIKGVWRERCEQLERLYVSKEELELVDTPHNLNKALWGLGENITMSTRIFGSTQHPGRLFFEDARLTREDQALFGGNKDVGSQKNLQTSDYTQVRLERPTRTAVFGALYTSEFGLRNFLFKGSVNGWLRCTSALDGTPAEPTYSLLLLLAGLHMLERLGGNKSAGKGACTCKITKLQINDREIQETQWQGWLERLDLLGKYTYKSQEEQI